MSSSNTHHLKPRKPATAGATATTRSAKRTQHRNTARTTTQSSSSTSRQHGRNNTNAAIFLPSNATHIIHQGEAPSSHMAGLAGITPHTLAKSIGELLEGVYGSAAKGAQQVRELIYLMENQDEEGGGLDTSNATAGRDSDEDEETLDTDGTVESTPNDRHLVVPGQQQQQRRRRSSGARRRSSVSVASLRSEHRKLTFRRVSETIRTLAMLGEKADADLRYKIQPWRSAFQQWVEQLHESMVDLNCGHNIAIPVELFLRRVVDATRPSPAALPTSKDPFSQRALANVPHLLTTAAAVFVFDKYLLPLLGPHYELLARRAFHELVKAVYQAPPPLPPPIASLTTEDYQLLCRSAAVSATMRSGGGGTSSAETRRAEQRLQRLLKQHNCTLVQPKGGGSATTTLPPLFASSDRERAGAQHSQQQHGEGEEHLTSGDLEDLISSASNSEASTYVNTTFVSRFHDLKHIFVVLRDRHRQQTAVQERQDNILARTIVRWQQQTLATILTAWNQYTKRAKKLRQRYGKVILSLSETGMATRAIKLWLGSARKIQRQATEKKAKMQTPEEISSVTRATTEQITLRHKLQAQVNLKQTREAMIERAKAANAKSQAERAKRDAMIRGAQERYHALAEGAVSLIDTMLPAADSPLQQLDVADEDVLDDFREVNATEDEKSDENAQLLLWVSKIGSVDKQIAGRKLYHVLSKLASKDNSVFSVGVIARAQHLIPVLRLLVTLHSPAAAASAAKLMAKPDQSQQADDDDHDFGDFDEDAPFSNYMGAQQGAQGSKTVKIDDVAPELSRLSSQRQMTSHNLAMQQTLLSHTVERRKSGAYVDDDPMKKRTLFGSFRIPAHEGGANLYGKKTQANRELEEQQEALFANERKKQLNTLISPLASCETVTHVANYVLSLANRLTKNMTIGVSQTLVQARKKNAGRQAQQQQKQQGNKDPKQNVKLLPATFSKFLVYNSEQWRNLLLAYIQYTQLSPSCSVFKTLGTTSSSSSSSVTSGTASAAAPTPTAPTPAAAAAKARQSTLVTSPSGLSGLPKKSVGFSVVPATALGAHSTLPADARELLAQRMNQRKALAARAQSADEAYGEAMAAILTATLDGGDIALEARRVYETFCDSNVNVSSSARVTADFLASKMRIVFGRDSAFWRPATTNRVIESAKQMEEYIATVASISPLSPLDLCSKLLMSCDDCDLFFCALQSDEICDAMEQHLSDLSLIFSLYAEGEAPMYKITKDSWMLLNNPWIESQSYNLGQAEYVFDLVLQRCLQGIRSREADLVVEEEELGVQDDPRNIPGYGMEGLDMDAFCQALCIVTQFKIPTPFQPLENKFHVFTETWLIPMVGAKSKLVRRKSSVRKQSAAAPLQFPIPMHLMQQQQDNTRQSSDDEGSTRRSVVSARTGSVMSAMDEMAEDPSLGNALQRIPSTVSMDGRGGSVSASPENARGGADSVSSSRHGSLQHFGGSQRGQHRHEHGQHFGDLNSSVKSIGSGSGDEAPHTPTRRLNRKSSSKKVGFL